MEPAKSANAPPSPASPPSADLVPVQQFIKSLSECELFPAEEVQAWLADLEPAQGQDTRLLAQTLVKQGRLTRYQAQMLCQGRTKGLVLGNYVILDKVGQGGMGMVFRAQHRRMKRVVALKVLTPAITKNPTAVQRFLREVEAAAKLNHPNIVAAFDADEAQGVHFLVMEFVDGADLAQLVKKQGPLPIDQAVQCVLQAARGLEHAHAAGIIHRDIKPHNLLLASAIGYRPSAIGQKGEPISGLIAEGRQPIAVVKILDMGLARIEGTANAPGQAGAAELTQSGTIMGTCDYMAPEQAMNTKRADQRADIYSLGCTLYYLLTARATYGGETAMEKLMAHQQDPIPSLLQARPEVPQQLETIYQKMLAKKPEERYQSMTEVIAALEGLGSQPSGGDRPSTSCQLPKAGAAELTDDYLRPAALDESQSDLDNPTVGASKSMLVPAGLGGWLQGKGKWLAAAVLGLAALLLLGLAIFRVDTPEGTFVIETDDPQIAVMLDKAGGVIVHDQKTQRKFTLKGSQHRLPTGDYELEVADSSGLAFNTRLFTIKRGENTIVRASFEKATPGGQQPPKQRPVIIDLIPLVDVQKDAVKGTWKSDKRNLVSDIGDDKDISQLRFPYHAPAEYNLQVKFRHHGGNKVNNVYGPFAGKAVGGYFSKRDFKLGKSDSNPIKLLQEIQFNQPYTLKLEVREKSVTAYLDGTRIVEWHPDERDFANLEPAREGKIGLLHWGSRVTYESVQVTEITGQGRFTRPDDPAAKKAAQLQAAVDDAWIKSVQALPPEKQVEAVAAKLMNINPGFHDKVLPFFEFGKVVALDIITEKITDISPVSALRDLQKLKCLPQKSWTKNGKLTNLAPLRGLQLTELNITGNPISDLSPLQGMPLKFLKCGYSLVTDISPLQGMKLEDLDLRNTPVSGLLFLKNLEAAPAVAILRSIKTLKSINNQPAAEFWKKVDAKTTNLEPWHKEVEKMPPEKQVEAVVAKLKELNPGYRGAVKHVIKDGVAVTGLTFAADPGLTDIAPLRALPALASLTIRQTQVSSLAPLAGLQLSYLDCRQTRVTDFAILQTMPLQYLQADIRPERDAAILKAIKTLRLINDQPAAAFWKEVERR